MSGNETPVETELKLTLSDPEAENDIVAHIRGKGYKVKELKPVRNTDTYLDTFDWTLFKKKLALRYRSSNGTFMYTIKGIGEMENGVAQRTETEISLDGPAAVPSEITAKQIREQIEEIIYPRKLLEHIQIRTDRRPYRIISPEGAKIELAFDTTGFYLRGLHKPRRAGKLHELEAELLHGSVSALQSLAILLTQISSCTPSTASKLETAIERLHVSIPSKKLPEIYRIRLDDRLDLAVRKILAYQFSRFREHLSGVRHDVDTEFVHQARVSTRRMRSALRLFGDAVPKGTCSYLTSEMQWLGGLFGTVRDLDVFLLNLPLFQQEIDRFPKRNMKIFDHWIRRHRRSPFEALTKGLESLRYTNFEKRFLRFLELPLPARPRAALALKRVREVAPAVIREKFDAVIKQGHKVLENPKMKQFHQLRIQMKRLRYACEFMASAYDGALEPFIERTTEIQDCLGELQDTVFTRGFIDTLYNDWKNKLPTPKLIFILGEIYQLQREIADERQKKFGKIWERFSSEEISTQLQDVLSSKAAEQPEALQKD